jgi:hypothetical protein
VRVSLSGQSAKLPSLLIYFLVLLNGWPSRVLSCTLFNSMEYYILKLLLMNTWAFFNVSLLLKYKQVEDYIRDSHLAPCKIGKNYIRDSHLITNIPTIITNKPNQMRFTLSTM